MDEWPAWRHGSGPDVTLTPRVTHAVERRTFHTLDGLRGVAAGAVLVYHFPKFWAPLSAHSAYLSVDLFFLMSGFIIEHAYGQRLAVGLSARRFLILRIVRLYPLYIIGTAITVLAIAVATLVHESGVQWTMPMLIGSFLYSALMLPTPDVPHTDSLYPLNVPAWSLFYELLTNLLFAASYNWWSLTKLRLVISVAAAGLVIGCWRHGNLDLGSGYGVLPIFLGVSRVLFSFFLGVLVHRSGWGQSPFLRWASPPLLLAVVLLLLTASVPDVVRGPYDLVLVMIVFPAVLLAAVTTEPVRARRGYAWLGLASYAVYMIHEPLLRLATRVDGPVLNGWLERSAPFSGVAALIAMFTLAMVLDRFYDLPVRSRLLSIMRLR